MTIPKKGTRKIIIDGKTYRWFAQADDDCSEKFFIIESVDDKQYRITGSFPYEINFVISPCIVRQAVKQAEAKGWKPGTSDVKKIVVDITKIKF